MHRTLDRAGPHRHPCRDIQHRLLGCAEASVHADKIEVGPGGIVACGGGMPQPCVIPIPDAVCIHAATASMPNGSNPVPPLQPEAAKAPARNP